MLTTSCEERGYKGRIINDELKQNFPALKRWRRRTRRKKNKIKKKRRKGQIRGKRIKCHSRVTILKTSKRGIR